MNQPRVHTLFFPLPHPYGSQNAEVLAHELLARLLDISGVKSVALNLDAGHIAVDIEPSQRELQKVIVSVLAEVTFSRGAGRSQAE